MFYEETWSSLKRHRIPEWLDDAKFGIYFHWGPYSVPAFGNEWYPKNMYIFGDVYHHHCQVWGEPEEFGYKDFIPRFTGEHFDADEWVRLFKAAGAKFAGPVAEHHDGFSMWASKVNPWNSVQMGPKRDIVGEMEKAVRSHGLKFITTFHHANNWYYYYHMEGLDTSDPRYEKLYGRPHAASKGIGTSDYLSDRPDKEFCEFWFQKLKEVIDAYRPDLIWFDFCLARIHDKYKRKFAAYYYNAAEEWGKEVEIIYKEHNLPPCVGILDYERGRSAQLTYHKWVTDTILGTKSWSYIDDEVYKPVSGVIHNLIDNVSKNGLLLLNFGPKANGEIPEEVRVRMRQIGEWLKINGEGLYGSTPWVIAEEGPTKLEKSGGFSELKEVQYSAKDLRFTSKDNCLYCYFLGWPGRELQIRCLTLAPELPYPSEFYIIEPDDIKSIRLLGYDGELSWRLTGKGLIINLPQQPPCEYAFVVKIEWN